MIAVNTPEWQAVLPSMQDLPCIKVGNFQRFGTFCGRPSFAGLLRAARPFTLVSAVSLPPLANPALPAQTLSRVMVVGASASGTGLAFLLARAGHMVEIVETDAGAVERAEQALNRLNREMPPGPDTARLPEVRIADGYATPAEIIIEALAEGPEAAAETLARPVPRPRGRVTPTPIPSCSSVRWGCASA